MALPGDFLASPAMPADFPAWGSRNSGRQQRRPLPDSAAGLATTQRRGLALSSFARRFSTGCLRDPRERSSPLPPPPASAPAVLLTGGQLVEGCSSTSKWWMESTGLEKLEKLEPREHSPTKSAKKGTDRSRRQQQQQFQELQDADATPPTPPANVPLLVPAPTLSCLSRDVLAETSSNSKVSSCAELPSLLPTRGGHATASSPTRKYDLSKDTGSSLIKPKRRVRFDLERVEEWEVSIKQNCELRGVPARRRKPHTLLSLTGGADWSPLAKSSDKAGMMRVIFDAETAEQLARHLPRLPSL
ncbi:unnamed protein product [Polarella glacialis]|uniref:Uncharacterized protein n=1 Tax=Polarella glacialis TaxID=89957 RepID=A0A813DIP6_POLGL|nr:unnamed protein product [Polarella glacialis]